ncbi:MAG: RNA 2',3'-cyclic phosphodiesterase [Elusimicrobia bacterium]|nr:RNA 2',3'-cyclic phosphodiesterase [Elusimicrobiota bacterium]
MRLFVSTTFDRDFTEGLAAAADYARANSGQGAVKWVAPENFHLTYAFLGDLGEKAAAAAAEAVKSAAEGQRAFDITTGAIGMFPSARRPSVIWVGVDQGALELRALAARLAEFLAASGIMFENRFEPHITVGRVKGPLPEGFSRRVTGYSPSRRGRSRVASVELTRSELTPEGPVYTRMTSVNLL